LGLALVYGVVQQSGGFIRVHSTPGHGSIFDIFLPLVSGAAQKTIRGLRAVPITQGREQVLLIEDDDVVRRMVSDILSADGYTVNAATNSRDALELLKKERPPVDLIIVQVGPKPSRDDEVLARSLHLMLPDVRVLKIGAPDCEAFPDLNPALQACLPKPFTLSALLKSARMLLDPKSTTQG
jgi:CheY-like chemotaxis protein